MSYRPWLSAILEITYQSVHRFFRHYSEIPTTLPANDMLGGGVYAAFVVCFPLSVQIYLCPFVRLSFPMPVCSSVYPFFCKSFCLTARQSFCLVNYHLSVHMYFCPSYSLSRFISLFVRYFDRLLVPLPFCPSIFPLSSPFDSQCVSSCVCLLVCPSTLTYARICMIRPSFLYSLHLTARAR